MYNPRIGSLHSHPGEIGMSSTLPPAPEWVPRIWAPFRQGFWFVAFSLLLTGCGQGGCGQATSNKGEEGKPKEPLVWQSRDFAPIHHIAISPDGRRALTVGQDAIPVLLLWDLSTGEVIRKEFSTARGPIA